MIPRCENLYSTMALRPAVDTCTRIYSRRFISGLPGDTSYTFRCWVQTSSNQENPKLSVYFMAVFVPLGLSFRAIKISWLKAYLETGANWEGKEENKIKYLWTVNQKHGCRSMIRKCPPTPPTTWFFHLHVCVFWCKCHSWNQSPLSNTRLRSPADCFLLNY